MVSRLWEGIRRRGTSSHVSSVQHKARIMHILPPHPRIPWTSEDNEYLKRWYLRRGGEFVARALSRKRNAIEEQARKLGITRDDLRSWTEAENEVIRKFGATHSASELGLQVASASIVHQAPRETTWYSSAQSGKHVQA